MATTASQAQSGSGPASSSNLSPASSPAGSSRRRGAPGGAAAHPRQLEDDRLRLARATTADHAALHAFLISVQQAPSSAEFHAQLEHPEYQPYHRLLLRRGPRILGHVHLRRSQMAFGPLQLPVLQVTDLAMLPEYRMQGYASALLEAAERIAGESWARPLQNGSTVNSLPAEPASQTPVAAEREFCEPAMLGLARTTSPQFFVRSGWAPLPGASYSIASVREVLAQVGSTSSTRQPYPGPWGAEPPQLNIRLWRQVEQDALMQLYARHLSDAFGSPLREEVYWRWLINRRAYDRIYVAIEGPDRLELTDTRSPILGYAVMKEGRILELVTAPGQEAAGRQLLARACGDAIEADFHTMQLDAPPHHPLHASFQAARGSYLQRAADEHQTVMAKLYDPVRVLASLGPQLQQRLQRAGLAANVKLGLLVDRQKYSVVVTRRRFQILRGQLGRSYLQCTTPTLTQLLLGCLDVQRGLEQQQMQCSTRLAADTAAVLFPRVPLWIPPWDHLAAPGK